MPRPRINYASQALYVGPSPATGSHFGATGISGAQGLNLVVQLHRVQTCNENYAVSRKDVNEFGELAALDRVILDSPTASIDFGYILANLANEAALGFTTNGQVSCISGILNGVTDQRNYFLKVGPDGTDEIGDLTNTTTVNTMGIGNGFITSYSVSAGVGKFVEVAVKVEGLNAFIQNSYSGVSPAVNPVNGVSVVGSNYTLPFAIESAASGTGQFSISALRPGDLTISIYNHGTLTPYTVPGPLISDAKIQNLTMGVNLSRDPIQQLGARFAVSRLIRFPLTANLSIDAIAGDFTTGNLGNIINCDNAYDVVVSINTPADCIGTAQTPIVIYSLKSAKLDNLAYSSSITSNTTVKLDFSVQIGGPNQTGVGLFMSGLAPALPSGFN